MVIQLRELSDASNMTDTESNDARHERIRDRAVVLVRQLSADDYDAVVLLALSLTPSECYLRFFTTHPGYLDEWAHSTTEATGPNQCTLGAFEGDSLLGVATYVGTDRPDCAEASVLVAHDQHDRGIGTVLLRRLGMVARDNGFHHLIADVLAENRSMTKVIADAGWPSSHHRSGYTLSYDVNLDDFDEGRSS